MAKRRGGIVRGVAHSRQGGLGPARAGMGGIKARRGRSDAGGGRRRSRGVDRRGGSHVTPLSITLENFLCYSTQGDEHPHVFDFRPHRLWSISGNNGAGKSAIFDAITYCLFGEHRGGRSGDEQLVHKGARAMSITFEFSHGGTDYKVTRRVQLGIRPREGTATTTLECQMERHQADGRLAEVADTVNTRGPEAAVERPMGVGGGTLTASVLLIQCKD